MADVPGPRTAPAAAPIRVVVVEDHDVVRQELVAQLVDAGMIVVSAAGTFADGREAVVGSGADVAVVDSGLPDGSGLDLCRELAAVAPATATILHTATLLPGQERAARDAGAHAVVLKSMTGRPLLEAIRRSRPIGLTPT